ncbi:hypothetical protein BAUCODRAFT_144298 [Baudoinia panamericana UAMH 10762]|uniref:PKS/mFAS DH domain-containing protein n=1 Tax=Baudoinia panamericana (strain UAMH 10762) TaxID=717646 RepID=M2NN56_BAUPA|nr:uncharacterized protein BAUCODRAFT_144298 [Baudoinia panamericana UAMH 10762]EMD00656.1 hypothetical protein BAUCODRAFT_144298 [Baudoinia panamericana UAMH 10762]
MPVSGPIKELSASAQQVIEEAFTGNRAKLTVGSNLADPRIWGVIAGHKCNGVTLVPSSLWADMALVGAQHIWNAMRPESELPGLNVGEMESPKGLIAKLPQPSEGQWVEMEANAELDASIRDQRGIVRCRFRSIKPDGTKIQEHASCTVRYEDKDSWRKSWAAQAEEVRNSIKLLHDAAYFGGAQKLDASPAYDLFGRFVTYGDNYRGMDEVVFDELEGTSVVTFKTDTDSYTGSYHIDNSCHLSGFLCNALDDEKEECVYISEGWHSARYFDMSLLWDKTESQGRLTNYARMAYKDKGIVEGDLYLFKDDALVSVWEGLKFKRIPRRVMNIFLPRPQTSGAG